MRHPLDFWRSDAWTPTRELSAWTRNFDRLFEDVIAPLSAEPRKAIFNPACDIEESPTHYLLSFDLPGISKEEVKIEVLGDRLMVSGERKSEKTKDGARHVVERSYGSFQRAFTLPAAVETSKIEANFENGVLWIAVPKSEPAKAQQIKIADQKGQGFFNRLLGTDKENKVA